MVFRPPLVGGLLVMVPPQEPAICGEYQDSIPELPTPMAEITICTGPSTLIQG